MYLTLHMLCTSAYIHAKFKLKPKLGSNSQLTLAFLEQNLAIRSSPLTFFGDLFDDQLRTPEMGGPNPSVGSSDPSTMQQHGVFQSCLPNSILPTLPKMDKNGGFQKNSTSKILQNKLLETTCRSAVAHPNPTDPEFELLTLHL